MRARISKRTVDKLRPGGSIADLDVRGFSARCLPSGAISYDLRYRTTTGDRRRISLGLHGAVTPDQARPIAEKRLDELARDRDPAVERQRQRTTTVNAVLDNYVARVLGNKRSKPAQVSAFDRLVRPEIGTRSIYDLRRADIARLLDTIEDSSGRVMADRTLDYLRGCFNWQQGRDDNFLSPIIRGMARTTTKELARDRDRGVLTGALSHVFRSVAQGRASEGDAALRLADFGVRACPLRGQASSRMHLASIHHQLRRRRNGKNGAQRSEMMPAMTGITMPAR
jgi:hypothetical protein